MDFYITKEEVVKSINLTLGVVEKRQTLPILSNVLFFVVLRGLGCLGPSPIDAG